MATISDWDQRQLDIASGQQMDALAQKNSNFYLDLAAKFEAQGKTTQADLAFRTALRKDAEEKK
jgi:hypothetical protein